MMLVDAMINATDPSMHIYHKLVDQIECIETELKLMKAALRNKEALDGYMTILNARKQNGLHRPTLPDLPDESTNEVV